MIVTPSIWSARGVAAARRRRLAQAGRLLGLVLLMWTLNVPAQGTPASAAQAELEQRMLVIADELRCLVCQNQTIADSHSELAQDLRAQIRRLLSEGKSADEVRAYMTQRYGDFVLYRPPLTRSTALLWFGPGLLLFGGLAALLLALRRRSRMPPRDFDPDDPLEPRNRS